MLPISVLIPTRNAIALLPRHLETMRPWLDSVAEIIVVDSHSEDGTWQMLQSRLPAAKTRFFRHPPGLYASWNFGIRQARAPFLYVSTVGDLITREGLEHLHETAHSLGADVVVSPPEFVNEQERPIRSNPWPVHRLISRLELTRPVRLDGLIAFACALAYIPFAMLGSSASNLYRTATLQEKPFPTGFGSNGDGAWGVFHLLEAELAITPRRISFFKHHPRPGRKGDKGLDAERSMLERGLQQWEIIRQARPHLADRAHRLGLADLIEAKRRSQHWRERLLRERVRAWPWSLNPAAWLARTRRDVAQRCCEARLNALLQTASLADRHLRAPAMEPALT